MRGGHVLGVETVRDRTITAGKVAVNTVTAGGLPLHFPALTAAMAAMLHEAFSLHGASASIGGRAVLVNVDERRRLGMDGTFNAPGNSNRASAMVGRAIRLCLVNLLDVLPGGIDRSTLGHPGKFSLGHGHADLEHPAGDHLANRKASASAETEIHGENATFMIRFPVNFLLASRGFASKNCHYLNYLSKDEGARF